MCNRPIRELEVQFEKIHFTPDPAQHISRCPPALAAPRPCHPPRCQQPPSAAARSPLHSRQGCTWTVRGAILHQQGLTGRVFQLRVGSGSGIGIIY